MRGRCALCLKNAQETPSQQITRSALQPSYASFNLLSRVSLPSSGSISGRCYPKSLQKLKQNKSINFKNGTPLIWSQSLGTLRVGAGGRAKSLQSYPSLCHPMDCSPPGSSVHAESPGKNTAVRCQALLQGIFLTQGWTTPLRPPTWQAGSLRLLPPGKPPRKLHSFHKQCQQEAAKDIPFINTCYLLQHNLPQ